MELYKGNNFIIRNATIDDADTLLQLMKELNVYLREPKSVVTKEDLIKNGLTKDKILQYIVAEENCHDGLLNDNTTRNKILGYASYYFAFSEISGKIAYMESLYLRPESRSTGIGTALVKTIGQIALEEGCAKMAWVCYDWNIPTKEFYIKIGAKEHTHSRIFNFDKEAIKDLLKK